MKITLIFAVFCFTYVLIAVRRLRILPIGRPAGALLGALLMIGIGALTPDESYLCIDHNTILLLFGTMLLTVYLDNAGFFEKTASAVLSVCKTPVGFMVILSILSAVLSAFLVNDTVCIFLTPVVVTICYKSNLPMGPYLIALATSANIGSSCTLVGNPQNMIIGHLSKFSFAEFLLYVAPAAGVGLVINVLLLLYWYRHTIPQKLTLSEATCDFKSISDFRMVAITVLLVIAGFFCGLHLGYTAVAGCLILILYERKNPQDALSRVDWGLLIFFCSLFIVTKALAKTGFLDLSWKILSPYMNLSTLSGVFLFSAFMTIGSQLISNVPMVLLTGPYLEQIGTKFGWVLLAFTTTIAGNLTLIGSVANIIVAERAKQYYCLGFWEYLRFGFISTLVVLVVGVLILWAIF